MWPFHKDGHNAAMQESQDALRTIFNEIHNLSPQLEDDIWLARVKRRLIDSGGGIFLWGFLDIITSKHVRDYDLRSNITGQAIARQFDHKTSQAIHAELNSSSENLILGMFKDGQKAGDHYLKGKHGYAIYTLLGLLGFGRNT